MGINVKTSLTLLLVAITVGAIHGNVAGSRRRTAICRFVATSCGRQLMPMIEGIQSSGQVPDLDTLCSVANHARTCMGDCFEMMMGNPQMGRALAGVLDYVCAAENREEVTEAMEAPCFQDGTIERQLEGAAEDCVEERMTSRIDAEIQRAFARGVYNTESIVCPLVHNVISCIDDKVEEMCPGQDAVPFVNSIFNIVLREMLSSQMPTCFDQVTGAHSVVKRAIDYLKMIRKK